MVNEVLKNIKFERSRERITKHPGVIGVAGLGDHYNYPEFFKNRLIGYASNNAYPADRYPLLQVYTRAAGGIGINETRRISNDVTLCRLLYPARAKQFEDRRQKLQEKCDEQESQPEVGERYFPKESTMSDYYERSERMHAHRARRKNREVAYRMIQDRGENTLWLDFDGKIHASSNRKAKKTRKGHHGYHPFYVTAPDAGLCMDHCFRPGNAGSASNYHSAVRTHLNSARQAGMKQLEATFDSAGCQVKVLKRFKQENARTDMEATFYTRPASPNDHEDMKQKVADEITAIPSSEWKPVRVYYDDQNRKRYRLITQKEAEQEGQNQSEEGKEVLEIGETRYTLSNNEHGEVTARMVVIRRPKDKRVPGQNELIRTYRYKPVLTNNTDAPAPEVIEKYNRRGGGEDVIGEIVEDGDAERFPCESDSGNALYLGLNVAAHNLINQQEYLVDHMPEREETNRVSEQNQTPGKASEEESRCSARSSNQSGSGATKFPIWMSLLLFARMLIRRAGECVPEGGRSRNETSSTPSTETDHRGALETAQKQWQRLTLARFRDRLINVPVRVTKGGRYRRMKIEETYEWAHLFERYVNVCFNPQPAMARARSPDPPS